MALFRALESSRPSAKRLFNDPFAYFFLRPSFKCVVHLSRVPLLGAVVPTLIDHRWPGARSSRIARTRLIDDYLSAALRDGIDQVVILGAGFDCRAHRIANVRHVRILELDYPAVLSQKKVRLRRILGALPAYVAFVHVDLNSQPLREVLRDSAFAATRRSSFVWEGVTNYLTEQAADDIFRDVGQETAPGSRIAFTHVHRGLLDRSEEFAGTRHLWKTTTIE